jgi:hypothetical protein
MQCHEVHAAALLCARRQLRARVHVARTGAEASTLRCSAGTSASVNHFLSVTRIAVLMLMTRAGADAAATALARLVGPLKVCRSCTLDALRLG